MTTEAPAPTLSLQELRNATELLEREGVASGVLTAAALDARRPGSSPAYAGTGPGDWFAYALWLARQAGDPARDTAARPRDQVIHEALAETPVTVTLRNGLRVSVYAKSLDTLIFLEALDADLRTVHEDLLQLVEAEARGETSAAQTVFLAALLNRLSLRLYWWVLTTEGPGLPFREDEASPTPPEWTAALHAEDVDALMRAHLQVNRNDLEFLAATFPSEPRADGARLPLSGFLGAMAHEWGLPAREVLQRWTLRGLYAQASVAAESHRQAHAAAERERERRTGRA